MSSLHMLRHDAEAKAYHEGQAVFACDDPATEMYVVAEGAVEIRLGGLVLERVEAGGIIGEMALIEHLPRSASAVAVEPSKLVPIDQERFLYLVRNHPYFAIEVMKVLAHRLRTADATIKKNGQA